MGIRWSQGSCKLLNQGGEFVHSVLIACEAWHCRVGGNLSTCQNKFLWRYSFAYFLFIGLMCLKVIVNDLMEFY